MGFTRAKLGIFCVNAMSRLFALSIFYMFTSRIWKENVDLIVVYELDCMAWNIQPTKVPRGAFDLSKSMYTDF